MAALVVSQRSKGLGNRRHQPGCLSVPHLGCLQQDIAEDLAFDVSKDAEHSRLAVDSDFAEGPGVDDLAAAERRLEDLAVARATIEAPGAEPRRGGDVPRAVPGFGGIVTGFNCNP